MAECQFRDGKKYYNGKVSTPVKLKESVSSNGHTKYTTVLWSDDVLTCDCPGWTIKKAGKERTCKHIARSIATKHADMTNIDEFESTSSMPEHRAQIVVQPVGTRQARGIRML